MKSAYLLALTTARGIDFQRVAGSSSNVEGIAAERKRRPDEIRDCVERIPPTVRGTETRVYRRPGFSHAELGIAVAFAKVEDLPWFAARFSYAGDPTSYWPLWWELLERAERMAERDGWAPLVAKAQPRGEKERLLKRVLVLLSDDHVRFKKLVKSALEPQAESHFYLPLLARLVLDEEANKRVFAVMPGLFADYMQVEQRMWDRVISARFRALQEVYQRWLGQARGLIQRQLSAREEEQELQPAGSLAYIRAHNLKPAPNTRA